VDVLIKSAPAWMAISDPRSFSSTFSSAVSESPSAVPVVVNHRGHRLDGVVYRLVVSALQQANGITISNSRAPSLKSAAASWRNVDTRDAPTESR